MSEQTYVWKVQGKDGVIREYPAMKVGNRFAGQFRLGPEESAWIEGKEGTWISTRVTYRNADHSNRVIPLDNA